MDKAPGKGKKRKTCKIQQIQQSCIEQICVLDFHPFNAAVVVPSPSNLGPHAQGCPAKHAAAQLVTHAVGVIDAPLALLDRGKTRNFQVFPSQISANIEDDVSHAAWKLPSFPLVFD